MFTRFFRLFFWALLVASIFTVAYLGAIRAPADSAILIEDIYSGFEPEVIGSGELAFVPERALPGRVRLYPVTIYNRQLNYHYRHGLRQSEVLGLDDSFFIQIELQLSYNLKPERLYTLFRQLGEKNWELLSGFIEKRVNNFLRERVTALYTSDRVINSLDSRLNLYLQNEFLTDLNHEFVAEGIEFKRILLERLYVPDEERYRTMVRSGRELLEQKIERIKAIDRARTTEDAERITDQSYYSRLEKIGELMERYPQLREYLAIDRLSKNVEVLVLPSDRWFGPSDINGLRRGNKLPESSRSEPSGPKPGRSQQSPSPPPPSGAAPTLPESANSSSGGSSTLKDLTPL